ncbi:DUF6933 domain-containing protein [Virgibacillus sp. FSP13]
MQCTKKLADELKIKTSKDDLVDNDPLYSWHAHIFLFRRKKFSLVMNNKTRYNFIIGGLRIKDFSQFESIVKTGIQENLLADGFEKHVVESYLNKCDTIKYAPTSKRNIISQINEMIMVAKQYVEYKGLSGMEEHVNQINRSNNDFVVLTLPDTYPLVAMKKALAEIKR